MISCRRWLLMLGALPLALAPQAGPSTAAAAATGACRLAWVTNWLTGTVAPLNVDTRTYGTTIKVGGYPWGLAVAPDGTKALVTTAANPPSAPDSNVTPIDLATLTAGPPIPVAPRPLNVAITPDSKRGLVTSQGASDGFVTPIDVASSTAGAPISLPGAFPVAITPDGSKALVGAGNAVVPINLATDTAGSPVSLPALAYDIAVTPDGTTALLALPTVNQVLPMVVATGSLLPPIAIPGGPSSVAVTPDGKTALVGASAALFTIDLATFEVSAPHLLPAGPNGTAAGQIAISSDGQIALVANAASNEIIPVALPAATMGTPISNGAYDPSTNEFQMAFDAGASAAACSPAAVPPPPENPPPTATPAAAATATPAFTG